MDKWREIAQEKLLELQKKLDEYPSDYGTMEFGRQEVREQWLGWLLHILEEDDKEKEP